MNDTTPEHTRRNKGRPRVAGNHPDIEAAYRYVEKVLHTADGPHDLSWHGWALREAFLAGMTYAGGASTRLLPGDFDHVGIDLWQRGTDDGSALERVQAAIDALRTVADGRDDGDAT